MIPIRIMSFQVIHLFLKTICKFPMLGCLNDLLNSRIDRWHVVVLTIHIYQHGSKHHT